MKRHLESLIRSARGGQAYWPLLAPLIEVMDPAQLEALYRILQNIKEDGAAEGKRDARRQFLQGRLF